MHILPLELLKCVETEGICTDSDWTAFGFVFQILHHLWTEQVTVLSKLWTQKKNLNSNHCKEFWVQDGSYLLGRQMRGHQRQQWTINLFCTPDKGAGGWHCPEWMQGLAIPLHSSPHTTVSSQWFPNLTFSLLLCLVTPHWSYLLCLPINSYYEPLCTYHHLSCCRLA